MIDWRQRWEYFYTEQKKGKKRKRDYSEVYVNRKKRKRDLAKNFNKRKRKLEEIYLNKDTKF